MRLWGPTDIGPLHVSVSHYEVVGVSEPRCGGPLILGPCIFHIQVNCI